MYNCQLHSSWVISSDAVWKEKNEDGTFTTHLEGKVLEYKPYDKLRFSIFHKSNQHNLKESELSFTLENQSAGILLKIEQGEFPNNSEGNKLYEECLAGLNFVKDNLIITINEVTSIK